MNVVEFISHYPGMKLATLNDNQKILDFYNSSSNSISGNGLRFHYERNPNFFQFLEFQSKDYFVFIGEEINGDISGVATIVFRPGYIQGKRTTVAYLGDLRMKIRRKSRFHWRKIYNHLISSIPKMEEFYCCQYFLTAVIDENKAAHQSLIHHPHNQYQYLPKSPYEMVNLLGPILKNKKYRKINHHSQMSVRAMKNSDKEKVYAFLKSEHQKKSFGFVFDADFNELEYRLRNWTNFDLNQCFLLENKNGEIQGFTALWSPSPSKKIFVSKIPRSLQFFLKIISFFLKVPKQNEEIKIQYLSLLTFNTLLARDEKSKILALLVDHISDSGILKDSHFLSFADYKSESLAGDLKNWIKFRTPMCLYQVLDKNKTNFDLDGGFPPGFEMALV